MPDTEFEDFEEQVDALEESLAGAQVVASSFAGELQQMRTTMEDTGRQVAAVSNGLSRGLRGAFDGLVFDGLKLSDALQKVGQSMVGSAYSAAINPVTQHAGRLLGGSVEALIGAAMPFADGASFAQGRVMPFARGGVVTAPVSFPMRGGTGLMGEAGPEAIMPLTRGADGKLGVKAEGGGRAAHVTINVTTPDVAGFRRSKSQLAAEMGRALGQGRRNR